MKHKPLELKPMSALTHKIKDEDIFIFEQHDTGIARMVINDRWRNAACCWCFRNEYK